MSELPAGCTMMITARAPLARVAALTASACCVQRNQLAGSPNTESLQASASLALEAQRLLLGQQSGVMSHT